MYRHKLTLGIHVCPKLKYAQTLRPTNLQKLFNILVVTVTMSTRLIGSYTSTCRVMVLSMDSMHDL